MPTFLKKLVRFGFPGGIAIALLAALLFSGCGGAGETTGGETAVSSTPSATGAATSAAPPVLYSFAGGGDNRTLGIANGVLPRIIESARTRGAAFMVNTGDVSNSGASDELTLYHDLTEGSGLRFYTVPGNHDVGAGGVSETYTSIIGETHYSFDFGGDHFIVLDNADDSTGIDDAQMQWFEADLAAHAAAPHQFIFTHIPVADPSLPSGHVSGESGRAGLLSGQKIVADAAMYPDVSALFFGHIHAYLAYELSGIDAYVTGGAGAPLYFPEDAGGYFHYLLVSVRADGISVEVVKV